MTGLVVEAIQRRVGSHRSFRGDIGKAAGLEVETLSFGEDDSERAGDSFFAIIASSLDRSGEL